MGSGSDHSSGRNRLSWRRMPVPANRNECFTLTLPVLSAWILICRPYAGLASCRSVRIADMNWMQVESYLERDDRIVLPLGCTEQHAYLSLATDSILAERVAIEAAEPLAVPVLPALAYGLTPYFAGFPGSPTVSEETYLRFVGELLDSLRGQGFRRFLLVNGHGGNTPVDALAADDVVVRPWCGAPRTMGVVREIGPAASHASWMESFPWAFGQGVSMPP